MFKEVDAARSRKVRAEEATAGFSMENNSLAG
jgi:hypothetical protein